MQKGDVKYTHANIKKLYKIIKFYPKQKFIKEFLVCRLVQ